MSAPKRKRKRAAKKPRKIELELTKRPSVHEAVSVVGPIIHDVADLFQGTERMLFANAIYEVTLRIAADEAGFDVDQDHPVKAVGRLLKAINDTADTTGRPHDEIVVEMLGKMGKLGIEHWN